MTKRPDPTPVTGLKERVSADVWIDRLATVLKTVDAMETDERSAAFNFLKAKYRSEWPSDGY